MCYHYNDTNKGGGGCYYLRGVCTRIGNLTIVTRKIIFLFLLWKAWVNNRYYIVAWFVLFCHSRNDLEYSHRNSYTTNLKCCAKHWTMRSSIFNKIYRFLIWSILKNLDLFHMSDILFLQWQWYVSPLWTVTLINQINQTVYKVLVSMLARIGRLDPQQLLQLSLSNGSTLCIPYFIISHFTLCSHVFLGLLLPLQCWTSNTRHLDIQSSTSFLSTCPYQRNLPFQTNPHHSLSTSDQATYHSTSYLLEDTCTDMYRYFLCIYFFRSRSCCHRSDNCVHSTWSRTPVATSQRDSLSATTSIQTSQIW